MSVIINANGDLVIKIQSEFSKQAVEDLQMRRNVLYDLIMQRSEDYIDRDTIYWAVLFLKDMELSEEQLLKALSD